MAIFRRMHPSNTMVCCFLLLLAFLATACVPGNGDNASMFALAAEQNNIFERRGLLRRAKSVVTPEVGSSDTTERTHGSCIDQVGLMKRLRKTRERIPLCDWVKRRKRRFCNRTIKRRNTFIHLREYCECTCLGVPTMAPAPTAPPTEPPTPSSVDDEDREDEGDNTTIGCPAEGVSPETELPGTSCAAGQYCGYRHVVTGCNASEYMCLPVVECYCQGDDTFMCTMKTIEPCDPYPPTRPPPPGWEPPPDNWGTPCDPENPPPTLTEERIVTR